jgi:hypothetical protein
MQGERTLEESLTTVGKIKTLAHSLQDDGQSLPQLRAQMRTFLADNNEVDLVRANSHWVIKCLALITLLRREFGEIGGMQRAETIRSRGVARPDSGHGVHS